MDTKICGVEPYIYRENNGHEVEILETLLREICVVWYTIAHKYESDNGIGENEKQEKKFSSHH